MRVTAGLVAIDLIAMPLIAAESLPERPTRGN